MVLHGMSITDLWVAGQKSSVPGRAGLPAETSNNVSVAAPVEAELARVQVGLESSSTTIVVLDIVEATSTLVESHRLGNLLHRGSQSTEAANQSDESSRELHFGEELVMKER